jgi:hypothetical protein
VNRFRAALAANLQRWRGEQRLTQQELAERCELPTIYLGTMEIGGKNAVRAVPFSIRCSEMRQLASAHYHHAPLQANYKNRAFVKRVRSQDSPDIFWSVRGRRLVVLREVVTHRVVFHLCGPGEVALASVDVQEIARGVLVRVKLADCVQPV